MADRIFSDNAKLDVIKRNLEKNDGEIRCESCGVKLTSIRDCHFDHIIPYSKGGRSAATNCQILCVNCNLKKNDKEMREFMLEEQARRFLFDDYTDDAIQTPTVTELSTGAEEMTKEQFDREIQRFLDKKGDIHKVDFSRHYDGLPSIHYMRKYYGDLNTMKKAFGIDDLSYSWNRETIKDALEHYVAEHGTIRQKDLIKANHMPSLPCILNYYPEYANFTDIKRELCHLDVPTKWTEETAIQAGKEFVKKDGKITQVKLGVDNHLPSANVIYNLFGSLAAYQEAVGSEITAKNEYITDEEIEAAVDRYFDDGERTIGTMREFFLTFPISRSSIQKRYDTLSSFCEDYGIVVLNGKKMKYSKQEVDDAIMAWVKAGKPIPRSKDLTKNGLPSISVIMKYYENWKEPFDLFQRMNEKINR